MFSVPVVISLLEVNRVLKTAERVDVQEGTTTLFASANADLEELLELRTPRTPTTR